MRKPKFILFYLLLFAFCCNFVNAGNVPRDKFIESQDHNAHKDTVNIGVIVDTKSWMGKVVQTCISMALNDFYNENSHYKTRIGLQMRDSKGDSLYSMAAVHDLLETVKFHAMIVPTISNDELFMARLCDKANVPLLSFSSIPSVDAHPYFLQVGGDETAQFLGIAALGKSFKWKECVILYENTVNPREIQQIMFNILQENHIRLTYQTSLSLTATNDQVVNELQKLIKMKTSIIIIHMSSPLASQVFRNAKVLGMVSKGFAWIITSKIMDFLDFEDSSVYELMQGVLGFRSYISASSKLHSFTLRLRRAFFDSNMEIRELNVYGVWAYDATWALAEAIERADIIPYPHRFPCNPLDLSCSKISESGLALLSQISNFKFVGLAGSFELSNHKLLHQTYEILNILGEGERRVGLWTSTQGLAKEIYPASKFSSHDNLETIVWPGISTSIPASQLVETSGNILRVGVPSHSYSSELVNSHLDPQTNVTIADGFCIELFRAAFDWLGYNISFEYIPFDGSYSDLVYQVFLQNFDAAAGDITINSNRSTYVDFTFPFTELEVGMIAKFDVKSYWFFLKPLDPYLWVFSAASFFVTGFIVWLIERRSNVEFQGSKSKQVGTVLWFSISTLVYAQRETLKYNLSKLVVGVWLFVVLILSASYTANLSSILTVRRFKLSKAEFVGTNNAIVQGIVGNNINFEDNRLKPYRALESYDEALRKGAKKGGVDAIIDELPYIKILLAKFPQDYYILNISISTSGFGFVFPKGSPLVKEVSRAILGLREEGKFLEMEKKWLKGAEAVSQDSEQDMPRVLGVCDFYGLFVISGTSKTIAIVFLLYLWFSERLTICWRFVVGVAQNLRFMPRSTVPSMAPTSLDRLPPSHNQVIHLGLRNVRMKYNVWIIDK